MTTKTTIIDKDWAYAIEAPEHYDPHAVTEEDAREDGQIRTLEKHDLTGRDAIQAARTHGLKLSKYTDPTEEARDGLSVEEAEEIAKEDQGLIYISDAELARA